MTTNEVIFLLLLVMLRSISKISLERTRAMKARHYTSPAFPKIKHYKKKKGNLKCTFLISTTATITHPSKRPNINMMLSFTEKDLCDVHNVRGCQTSCFNLTVWNIFWGSLASQSTFYVCKRKYNEWFRTNYPGDSSDRKVQTSTPVVVVHFSEQFLSKYLIITFLF